MNDAEKEYDEFGRVIRVNRSEEKRRRDAIKTFAQELLTLPSAQYALLPISHTLQAALAEGKRLTGNALKRHLNYLTRLLDEHDFEAVQQAHQHVNHPFLNTGAKIQRIQNEIERLVAEDDEIIGELFARYADLDIQHIRQLTRGVQKYRAEQAALAEEARDRSPGKHYRQLQKYFQNLALINPEDE
ncbi:DUF615 domain-containing protein [Suttonella sp. R2A3]|uniref:ribosome biogenesis factor YjgA n=1 Tax=Suttonella sp. R2A3 TaxID=2908648 RepID=UPI001F3F9B12|nr:ribosome biogenesis factor YjgA [Suttonella sp. R2A3]UJF25338.1 DUF615 domain-containing protein [Suttonella sp. R2A3]